MAPELVTPGVLYLVSEDAPSKTILGAGAGCFSVVHIYETPAVFLGGANATVDDVAANWAKISNPMRRSADRRGLCADQQVRGGCRRSAGREAGLRPCPQPFAELSNSNEPVFTSPARVYQAAMTPVSETIVFSSAKPRGLASSPKRRLPWPRMTGNVMR